MYAGFDPIPTMLRAKRKLGQMVINYQNTGTYLDFQGKRWDNAMGIVLAWEEYDREFGKIESKPSG
jgi:hypothetical protein